MTWKTQKLDDVAYLAGRIGWKGLTKKEYTKEGPYFLSVHGLNYGDEVDFRDAFHISQERYDESPEIMLCRDDVLICKDGAGIGKVGIVNEIPGPSTINSSLLLIRPSSNLIPKFLYYNLMGPFFQRIVQESIDGATTPHLYQKDIKTFPIPVPPLPEQKRIVSILDEAFGAIAKAKENAERNLANARELFDSYLNRVFSVSGEEFEERNLGEICEFASGGTPSKKVERYWVGDIPWASGRDMKSSTLSDTFLHVSQAAISDSTTKIAQPGSLLILVRGMGLAHGCQITEVTVPCAFNQDIRSILPYPEVDARFLMHAVRTRINLSEHVLSNAAHGTLKIDMPQLRHLSVPLPKMETQKLIAETIDGIWDSTAKHGQTQNKKICLLDKLKQSILQKAFTGQLTSKSPELELVP